KRQILLLMCAWAAGDSMAQTQPTAPAPAPAPAATPAAPPKDVPIEPANIAPGIYVLFGRGGNIGLTVGADGAAIIDDQFADMVPKIRAAVALLSEKPVRFVINTHLHGDHTGGNDAFGAAGAVIIAQDNVRKRLGTPAVNNGQPVPARAREALPV